MNIVIIDDHTLFRSGIETMITSLEPKTMIQSFESSANAIESVTNPSKIDLVLLDYNIPGTSTNENIRSTREFFENAKIVIVSGEEEADKVINAVDLGASGFIPKSSEPPVLIAALKLILAGGIFLPEQVLRYQTSSPKKGAPVEQPIDEQTSNPLERLTSRQYEVLMHMIDGKNNKTIAREVDLSLGTVKAHLSAAYGSLGVSNRTEAVVLASKYLRELGVNSDTKRH